MNSLSTAAAIAALTAVASAVPLQARGDAALPIPIGVNGDFAKLPTYCQPPIGTASQDDAWVAYDLSSDYSEVTPGGVACLFVPEYLNPVCQNNNGKSNPGWTGTDLSSLLSAVGQQAPKDGWKQTSTSGGWSAGFATFTSALSENSNILVPWFHALQNVQATTQQNGAGNGAYWLSQGLSDKAVNWVEVNLSKEDDVCLPI